MMATLRPGHIVRHQQNKKKRVAKRAQRKVARKRRRAAFKAAVRKVTGRR